MNDTLLRVEDLHVRFDRGGQRVHAVNGLSYQLRAGRTLAIIGESGSGKTVSSRALMGLLPPTATVTGSARLDDVELLGLSEEDMRAHRGTDIAMVFQDPTRSLNPTMRVGAQIKEALRAHRRVDAAAAMERSIELLSMVRIPDPQRRYHEYPHQLSGGMRQRVMIAIALACDPKLILADEPTTALDVTIQAQILELIERLSDEFHTAVLMITHDLGIAAGMCDRVNVMYAGRIVETATVDELFERPRMPYSWGLLDSLPRLDDVRGDRLRTIEGLPPLLIKPPDACRFEPRCRFARDICREDEPELTERGASHYARCWATQPDGWIP